MDSYFLAETLKFGLDSCAYARGALMQPRRYLFLLLDEGQTSAPYRNLSNFVYSSTLDFYCAALLTSPFSFNTEAHLLPLTAPPPPKFIPLLSRSSEASGAELPLPFTSSEHEEGSAALHVAAGTVAALLVGFYLCFRWRSGRCYRRQDRRARKRE
jgi:hypothetical protein